MSHIEVAGRYVELSNRHDLAAIGDLLDADATYRSAGSVKRS